MMADRETKLISIACLVIAMIACEVTSPLSAAERIVVLQTDWPGTPPQYVTIQGSRGTNRLHLMLKEGRHSPSDEWILHDVEPGRIRLESHDPFYKGWFLNESARPYLDSDFYGARQGMINKGIQPRHDIWRLQIEPDGLHRLWSCDPNRPDYALASGRRQHPNAPVFLLLRKITSSDLRHEACFKIQNLHPDR